jgi:D-alanyl-D-alanine carboxypeptidase
VTAALVGPAAASSATTTPSPVPSPGHRATPPQPKRPKAPNGAGGSEQQPTAAQLAAQAKAQALREQLREQATDAEVARAALADASQNAAAALQTYRAVVQAQQQAQLAAAQAQARLEQAGQAVETQRAALGRWAWQVYVSGGVLARSPAMLTLLDGGTTDQLATVQVMVKSVGDGQAQALDALRAAQAEQQQALDAATAAQQRADADAARAEQAKAAADDAVSQHHAALEHAQQALAATQQASADADRDAQLLEMVDSYVGGLPGAGHAVTGPVGDCPGGDVSTFPNGRIPVALLCPVWAAPGKYLRADAEYAFDRLSHAYAQAFGTPICVTDAYRSYEEQVRVFAERPGFAARPGSSNHGWGTAADLCGGIQSFGTRQHAWMLANAPLFGWFHPSWAEPTGSLPEAWHWEFGG